GCSCGWFPFPWWFAIPAAARNRWLASSRTSPSRAGCSCSSPSGPALSASTGPASGTGSRGAAGRRRTPARRPRFDLLLREHRLRDHAVHALAHVHHLRDAAIADHRDERVGLVAREGHPLLRHEEIHRLAHRVHHRLVEVLVESDRDPVGPRLDARPLELHVLAHDRLNQDLLEGALERGEVHFAVALAAVRVAGPD